MVNNNIIPTWEAQLRIIEMLLEDGEISYCAAIDRMDKIDRLPNGIRATMTKVWTEKGCPDVKR